MVSRNTESIYDFQAFSLDFLKTRLERLIFVFFMVQQILLRDYSFSSEGRKEEEDAVRVQIFVLVTTQEEDFQAKPIPQLLKGL